MRQLELVHAFPRSVVAHDGARFAARVYAAPSDGTTWEAWIVFVPAGGDAGIALPTERETTQPDLDAVRYWASGLQPVYLEGALGRAQRLARRPLGPP
jgi:hypothetical protein